MPTHSTPSSGPVVVELEDGSTITADSKEAAREAVDTYEADALRRWSRAPRGSTGAMVPVEVVAPPVSDDIVVVSPSGWRLEGLDIRDAVAVLRALS